MLCLIPTAAIYKMKQGTSQFEVLIMGFFDQSDAYILKDILDLLFM
jgi:hypothetical protein